MFLLINLHPSPSGKKGEQRKEGNESTDEDPGARHFPPANTGCKYGDQRDCQKKAEIAHIPKKQRRRQKAGIKNNPGARIKALN